MRDKIKVLSVVKRFRVQDESVMGAAVLSGYAEESAEAAGVSKDEWLKSVMGKWFTPVSKLYIMKNDVFFEVVNDFGEIFATVDDLGGFIQLALDEEKVSEMLGQG